MYLTDIFVTRLLASIVILIGFINLWMMIDEYQKNELRKTGSKANIPNGGSEGFLEEKQSPKKKTEGWWADDLL